MDLNSTSGFCLAICYLLRVTPGDGYVHFGMKCSSLCSMNMGTSGRSACASTGRESCPSVVYTNQLLERTTLLVLLCTCLGLVWTVEQPAGSVLEFYPAWRWLVARMCDVIGPYAVSKTSFWMAHYMSQTPKRHWMYSNSCVVGRLNKGSLSVKKIPGRKPITVRRYKGKDGRTKYQGTKALQGTERYPVAFAREMLRLLSDLKKHRAILPPLPGNLPSGQEMLGSLPSDFGRDEFSCAAVSKVYNYLRGGKNLNIPSSWRAVLPPGFL
ncbi:unnamed protein product [Symbiodinium necroappetens]|uniref:Uncharacterized protein n=1 Tax=Symbiodinium necroappetens TaxID=1628268 RepID=A0A812SRR8_9DINO|nr:unnamed protein product [Symbiodinium necroappetens]